MGSWETRQSPGPQGQSRGQCRGQVLCRGGCGSPALCRVRGPLPWPRSLAPLHLGAGLALPGCLPGLTEPWASWAGAQLCVGSTIRSPWLFLGAGFCLCPMCPCPAPPGPGSRECGSGRWLSGKEQALGLQATVLDKNSPVSKKTQEIKQGARALASMATSPPGRRLSILVWRQGNQGPAGGSDLLRVFGHQAWPGPCASQDTPAPPHLPLLCLLLEMPLLSGENSYSSLKAQGNVAPDGKPSPTPGRQTRPSTGFPRTSLRCSWVWLLEGRGCASLTAAHPRSTPRLIVGPQ